MTRYIISEGQPTLWGGKTVRVEPVPDDAGRMKRGDALRLGRAVRRNKIKERAERLCRELDRGECLKRAAHSAGMGYTTAKRHRRQLVSEGRL